MRSTVVYFCSNFISPRFREELIESIPLIRLNYILLTIFFYFGQLAEDYLKQARGACAVYQAYVYIPIPKIPSWEWIQEIIDIWNPVVKTTGSQLSKYRLAGLTGIALQPEVMLKIILGSAVLAAAQIRTESRSDFNEQTLIKLMERWPKVLEHGIEQLKTTLEVGLSAHKLIGKTASQPISKECLNLNDVN